MDYGTGSGKRLILGMTKAPEGKSKDTKNPKLGDAPEGIPSFVFGNFTWSYIFIHPMILLGNIVISKKIPMHTQDHGDA